MPDQILTLKEVAAYLKVSPSTLYRLLKFRSIPAFKMGSDWRFSMNQIDQWRLSQSAQYRPRA